MFFDIPNLEAVPAGTDNGLEDSQSFIALGID